MSLPTTIPTMSVETSSPNRSDFPLRKGRHKGSFAARPVSGCFGHLIGFGYKIKGMDETTNQSESITPIETGDEMNKEQFTDWMIEFGRSVSEYIDKLNPIIQLCNTFVQDMAWLHDAIQKAGATQNARRVFVRTAYSNAEGFLWTTKQMALNTDKSVFTPTLSDGDIAFLNDKELRTDPITEVVTEIQIKITLKDNIKKTKKILCRTKGCETFDIDLGSALGQKFFEGVRVRDRLTHPKRLQDMEVSDAEMLAVHEGVGWLTNSFGAFITLYRSARKANLDEGFIDMIAEAQRLGIEKAVIADFTKRVRPSYNES